MTIKLPELHVDTAPFDTKDGRPYSLRYADSYFGHADAIGESRHVFLAGNGLPDRWRNRAQFVIGELGFGTGLNFALTRELWLTQRRAGQRLHYVSVERNPFTASHLEQLIAAGPLRRGYTGLVERWPPAIGGHHRIVWSEEGVYLTLLFGDASSQLAELEAQVDAWYLDGFAPSRNPSLWTVSLLQEVARLSNAKATAATYSVAGMVRRGLAEVGFNVEKRPGHGNKREMTVAQLHQKSSRKTIPLWASVQATVPERITIVGAGIAGASAADAMNSRGSCVRIVDSADCAATGASGADQR